ncbi:MAG: DNA polymerase/3'-5' exonuclease PolX [Burkholderiales bacterium]
MAVRNADIAAMFAEIGDLLEIKGENPFRVRAYRNAARTIESLGPELRTMVDKGENLEELPAIGADLAAKIVETVRTGRCAFLDRLHRELPPAITELLKVPGIGPKRVKALHDTLDVQTLEELHRAARQGRVRDVPGFGEKTEAHILQAIEARLGEVPRFRLAVAAQHAEALVAYLEQAPGVRQVVVAGSYRRMKETVGDLDLLVTAADSSVVSDRFTRYGEVTEVLASGETRSSVRLASGLQVDLRVVPEESFGAALHYFTGAKAHNIAIRRLGQARGLKINEYGVFRGESRIAGDTEESVFASVDLPWIPPELREDHGEIDAAANGTLPTLVELRDLRGDLQAHASAPGGQAVLREMAAAARAAGLDYLAITGRAVSDGGAADALAKQGEEIDRLNADLAGITLLKGVEVGVRQDGSLDLPDAALAGLDVVIAVVDSRFDLPRSRQTERLLRAIAHPRVNLIAKPSVRRVGAGQAYDVDMPRVLRAARQAGVHLALTAHPERLGLQDTHCRMAKDEGVLVSVGSDAQDPRDFTSLRFGVGQARRGWLAKEDVLNTRELQALRPLLARKAGRQLRL